MYNEFFNQFIAIAIIHILAVMSPGPDFFLILKQSLSQGRLISLATSIGIDKIVFFLENNIAFLAAFALVSASASTIPSAFF